MSRIRECLQTKGLLRRRMCLPHITELALTHEAKNRLAATWRVRCSSYESEPSEALMRVRCLRLSMTLEGWLTVAWRR